MKKLKEPLTLNTAGGASRALGTVSIACNLFKGGGFESIVMPETPSVISVGERCMDHGYSFYWLAGKTPYLLLPDGKRVNLVVNGKIPYLHIQGSGAQGRIDVAAAEQGTALDRWACVMSTAKTVLEDASLAGGPPRASLRSRTTRQLHTQEIIAEHQYIDGKIVLVDSEPPLLREPLDLLIYFYYEPGVAVEHGWTGAPSAALGPHAPVSPHDRWVVGGDAHPFAAPGESEPKGGEGDDPDDEKSTETVMLTRTTLS